MNITNRSEPEVNPMSAVDLMEQFTANLPFEELVSGLVAHFKELWWSCEPTLPDLGPVYSSNEKKDCESKLVDCLERLGEELKRASRDRPDRRALKDRLFPLAGDFLKTTFGLEDRHVDALTAYGFAESVEEFVRRARQFDADISAADIYQAGRNAWSMNLLQYLMGMPVEVTPAVLAFSLLYPYSDNYLDDPGIPAKVKAAFSCRFERRLEGMPVLPANTGEQKIFDLVGMIEGQFDRRLYPEVYASLMAIFRAQTKSMRLQLPNASPYEVDVLGLVFEKGGTAVLADGYLVAGGLTPFQRMFSFYYGAFTQFMDDLEDVEQDRQDGIMTVFSQTACHWPLDAVTSRLIVFGNGLLDAMSHFHVTGLETLEEIMRKCITPLMIDSAGRVGHLYSRQYLNELERHSPYRFSQLKRLRRKVAPRFSTEEIVETIILANSRMTE
ncbi:MAG TPA: hypothetical protein VF352_01645 [Anaerolineales bacterium]